MPDAQQLAQQQAARNVTALMLAANNGQVRAIEALLNGVENNDVLTSQVDVAGNNALRIAILRNQVAAAIALVKAADNPMEMLSQKGADQLTTIQFAAMLRFADLRKAAGLEPVKRF